MSFNSTTRIAGPFLGDGVNKIFGFGFKVFANEDVLVELKDALGEVSEQVLTTDYLVTLNDDQNANPGGFITTTVAPAGGSIPETITLSSKVAETQPLVLRNQSAYYPRNIEDALDRNAILSQQLANRLVRSLSIPLSDGESVNLQLPTRELRANKGLKFDANGNVIVTTGDPDDVAGQVAQAEAYANASAASATSSMGYRDQASGYADDAMGYRDQTLTIRDEAQDAAALAESWAIDPIGDRPEGSAKYWSEQSNSYAGGVRISSNDTTAGHLESKVLAGNGVAMSTQNEGGDETRTIAVKSGAGTSFDGSGNLCVDTVLLKNVTVSSPVAAVELTGLDPNSEYDDFIIVGKNIRISATTQLAIQFSNDNGSSYLSSSNSYRSMIFSVTESASGGAVSPLATFGYLTVSSQRADGSQYFDNSSFECTVPVSRISGDGQRYFAVSQSANSTPLQVGGIIQGFTTSAYTNTNAVKITLGSAGNITSGNFRVYGRRARAV